MKTFSILLLTVMIAIFAEKYMAKYLLVEIDQPEGEANTNEDNSSGRISARATCSAKTVKYATAIMESCPGYKVLEKYSNPIGAKDNCCELTTHDSECGKSFFVNPVIGKCVCEKKGHDCIRTHGLHTEYRFGDESVQTPLECCKKAGVIGWCLIGCSPNGSAPAMACSPYRETIKQCLQTTQPKI